MSQAPIRSLLLLMCAALMPVTGMAFNAPAHQVVGHIAAEYSCVATQDAVKNLDPNRTIAEAGLWADQVRSESYWDALKPWHYINVPNGMTVAEAPRSRRGDVLLGIEKFHEELVAPETDSLDRLVAYRLLVHFVADLHQPLHVGLREDAGGNRVGVRVEGRRTSLHAYWDGYDLRPRVGDPDDYARRLIARYADEAVDTGGDPADWASESLALRQQVYALPDGNVPELTAAYRENASQVIDLRLYQAGVRLAGMLDAVYCNAK